MAGLPWFKLDSDFDEHPKTVRLCTRLRDPNAGMYVVRLMAYCSKHAPTGRVPSDMVEHAARWGKKAGAFVAAAVETGFLEAEGAAFILHGWDERNGAHVRKAAKDNARPRSDYRVPLQNPARGNGGNQRGSSAGDVEGEKSREDQKQLLPVAASPAPAASVPPAPDEPTPQHPSVEGAGETTAPKPPASPAPRLKRSEATPAAREKRACWEALFKANRGEDYRWLGAADQIAANALAPVDLALFVARSTRGLEATYGRCSTLAQLKAKWNDLAGPSPPGMRKASAPAEPHRTETKRIPIT